MVVPVLFVVGCKEEDGGDDCPDFDQACVGRLAVFDLKVFSWRFKKCGQFCWRHVVVDGPSALLMAVGVDCLMLIRYTKEN